MNTTSHVVCQRCSSLVTCSQTRLRPSPRTLNLKGLAGVRSGNLKTSGQFSGPLCRPPRQVATHFFPFDQAWGPSIDVEVLIILSMIINDAVCEVSKCRVRRSTPSFSYTLPLYTWIYPLDQFLQTINQTLPQNLFAISIVPYAGFLYHLTKSKQAPPLTLFGFYFLLVFVFATIPAGIYGQSTFLFLHLL